MKRKVLRVCQACAAWVWAILLPTVVAQEVREEKLPSTSSSIREAEEATDAQIRVVVTASRDVEREDLQVPQAVSVLDRQAIESSVWRGVEDLIYREPNIGRAPAEAGGANYWQQGFTIRGLGSQRVLTLIDGVRQSGQGIGYGGGNLGLMDPFQIERVEILRGPNSVLYGTDALGGVVQAITRKPRKRTEFGANGGVRYEMDTALDSHNFGAYADFGDRNVGMVLGGSWASFDRPDVPAEQPASGGDFDRMAGYGRIDWRVAPNSVLSFYANVVHNSDVTISQSQLGLPIFVVVPPPAVITVDSPLDFSFPQFRRTAAGVEWEIREIGEVFDSFKAGFSWQQTARQFRRVAPAKVPVGAFPFIQQPIDSVLVETDDETNTYEWKMVGRWLQGRHTLSGGFDLGLDTAFLPETETRTRLANGIVPGQPAVGTTYSSVARNRADATQLRVGLYAQDEIDFYPWTLIPGIRVDTFQVEDDLLGTSKHGVGASGSLGVVYSHNEQQSSYLNLASGFRFPDLGERFQRAAVSVVETQLVVGNPDLEPERSYSAEIGTKGEWSNWRYSAAVFYNYVDRLVDLRRVDPVGGITTSQYTNFSKARFYGLECAAAYKFESGWEFFGNAARTFTDDRDIVHVADWTFNYGTAFNFRPAPWVDNFRTALLLRTVLQSEDRTLRSGPQIFNDFTVLNWENQVEMGEVGGTRWEIAFGIKNVLNEEYEEPFFFSPQPERSFYSAVKVEF